MYVFFFFFGDPKDLNALLLLKSLAGLEAIMGDFQLHEGDYEDSHRPGIVQEGGANSVLLMPAHCCWLLA